MKEAQAIGFTIPKIYKVVTLTLSAAAKQNGAGQASAVGRMRRCLCCAGQ